VKITGFTGSVCPINPRKRGLVLQHRSNFRWMWMNSRPTKVTVGTRSKYLDAVRLLQTPYCSRLSKITNNIHSSNGLSMPRWWRHSQTVCRLDTNMGMIQHTAMVQITTYGRQFGVEENRGTTHGSMPTTKPTLCTCHAQMTDDESWDSRRRNSCGNTSSVMPTSDCLRWDTHFLFSD